MARIMTNVVIAEIEATKMASLELNAPIGVGVDLETGELTEIVKVAPVGDPVLKKTIIPGKLINEGFLKVTLTVERDDLEAILYLPIYSVTKIDGIKPQDHVVEVSELEHISVSGLPDTLPMGHSGIKVKIFVRALLKVMITVTREEIVSLPEDKKAKPPRWSFEHTAKSKAVTARSKEVSTKKRASNRLGGDETWSRYWGYMHRERAQT